MYKVEINIVATKKSNYLTEMEIVAYRFYIGPDRNDLKELPKEYLRSFHEGIVEEEGIDENLIKYFAEKNSYSKVEARWERSSKGEWYLRTIPNSSTSDNLLSLPDF